MLPSICATQATVDASVSRTSLRAKALIPAAAKVLSSEGSWSSSSWSIALGAAPPQGYALSLEAVHRVTGQRRSTKLWPLHLSWGDSERAFQGQSFLWGYSRGCRGSCITVGPLPLPSPVPHFSWYCSPELSPKPRTIPPHLCEEVSPFPFLFKSQVQGEKIRLIQWSGYRSS